MNSTLPFFPIFPSEGLKYSDQDLVHKFHSQGGGDESPDNRVPLTAPPQELGSSPRNPQSVPGSRQSGTILILVGRVLPSALQD